MTHPSLKPLQEKDSVKEQTLIKQDLNNIHSELSLLKEQTVNLKPSLFALIESGKMASLLESMANVYERINKLNTTEIREVLKENQDQFNQISSKFLSLTDYLDKLVANADLEREVLEKIKRQLPP